MAVAPDVLLSSAAAARPNVSPKAPPAPPEPAAGKSSSFARILADERQGPSESPRPDDAKGAANAADSGPASQNTGATDSSGEPLVADSGNPLPDTADTAEAVDPLALLGLTLGADAQDAAGGEGAGLLEDGLQAQPEVDAALVDANASAMPGVPVGTATVVVDPEVAKLNSAASVQVSLDIARKAEAEKLAAVQPTVTDAQGKGEAALKALGGLDPDAQIEGQAEEVEFELELSAKPLEVLKGATGDAASDSQSARLNPLLQAMNQVNQGAQAARAQVPGQPLSMHQAGWSEAVVDRVMWLSSQNLRSAEIQLDPAELGRLDVRVSLHLDQAQVSFSSPHAAVRDALEAQMHRMRELFAQQGINQLDVNVSDQSLARHSQGREDAEQAARGAAARTGAAQGEGEDSVAGELRTPQPATLRGLVDYYA